MRRLTYSAMIVVGILMVLPLLWMISSSFKNISEIFSYPPKLIPSVFRVENYSGLWDGSTSAHFPRWFSNSVLVAVGYLVPSLFFCSLAGFGFAKYDFRGRGLLFSILLASMMIPFYTVLVPVYALMVYLGWTDTFLALIVPFIANAFGVFLMKQYIAGIPNELLDAARIDGASEFRIFLSIILPLCKPALAALTIMNFKSCWNSFVWPMLVLSDPEKFTIPMGVAGLTGGFAEGQKWGAVMASSTLAVLPVLILFILMQKQFISGVTMGSIKG